MIVYEDVLGELGIRALFDLGVSVRIKGSSYPDPEDAEVVAAGWNGDRVSVARRKGRVAIMWRTIWARESDVEEFRDLLLTHSTDGAFHADGRVLDWVWCENPDVRRVLQGRLRRHPHPLKAAPEDR